MPRFKGYPDFTPNLTPAQIFKLGSFGGSYCNASKDGDQFILVY